MKKFNSKKILFFSFLICLNLYAYRYYILDFINNKLYGEYTLEELTTEQKLSDFDEFYTTIISSVPYLDELKALYHIDFAERRDYYREEIRKTENNYQFYCTMKAISKDLASFHTDICFPLYANLRGISCYHSRKVLSDLGRKVRIDAWTEEIGKAIGEYENVSILRVGYVDGKYVADEMFLPDQYSDLQGCELVKIDGEAADQYIVEHISTFKLLYDSIWHKAYRQSYALNDCRGQAVWVTWSNGEEEKTIEMYLDLGAEVASSYGHLFSNKWKSSYVPSVQMYRDDEHQLEYIQVNNFENNEGDALKTYLENMIYDTVVIDFRDNYGGTIDYAKKYIYPALYEQNVSQRYEWIVPDSASNRAMITDWTVRLGYRHRQDNVLHYYTAKQSYRGRAKTMRQIYYLVGPGTGSAADTYVEMIKENQLGRIVGSSTGGEGLGASFICNALGNSSLVYVYYPSVAWDEEMQEKLYEGTAPDYYVGLSYEDYLRKQRDLRDGTAGEYANRLEYDTVLKWVIENKK